MPIPESVLAVIKEQYKLLEEISFDSDSFVTVSATRLETELNVVIKLKRINDTRIFNYLKKMKEIKSEDIIRIYDVQNIEGYLFVVMQPAKFGTLARALTNCSYLEDADMIVVGKIILSGHTDMLRGGLQWFGDLTDIEITDTGLKLSWNNALYSENNPFPILLQALTPKSKAISNSKILPVNLSKSVQDLLRLSSESASEISLNPLFKKTDKSAKKKGKDWIALKETKSPKEYFEEMIYFAVKAGHGFVRIKVYDEGFLSPDHLALCHTKSTFTRIVETYNYEGKTYIVSEYSNEGTLLSYTSKLKASGLSLKEEHIEFFLYSLIQPLKAIQDSPIKALKILHIRNIFMEYGIPKLGEPIPMNSLIEALLREKSDVPDFYHPRFKAEPNNNSSDIVSTYDTYSLGVLLYKLMYTEYPIFPNGKVHIPSTPSYSKRLKTTLELLINEGGKLSTLESKIEVGESVVQQVESNKEKLVAQKNAEKEKATKQIIGKLEVKQRKQLVVEKDLAVNQDEEEFEEDEACCNGSCCNLAISNDEGVKYEAVEAIKASPYGIYRLTAKIILALLFYILVMYLNYSKNVTSLLTESYSLENINVKIVTVNYTIMTANSYNFYTIFNATNTTLTSLQEIGCFVKGEQNYTGITSSQWVAMIIGSLICLIALLVIKLCQIGYFDLITVLYNRQSNISNFNVSHFVTFNLMWCNLLFFHFNCFNFVFNALPNICVGCTNTFTFSSTNTLFNDQPTVIIKLTLKLKYEQFFKLYLSVLIGLFIILILHLIVLTKHQRLMYNRLLNPIMIVTPLWIVFVVIIRLGSINSYYLPKEIILLLFYFHLSALQNTNNEITNFFKQRDYVSIFGMIPELLLIGEILIGFLVDLLYWSMIEKQRQSLLVDTSISHFQIDVE